MIAAVECGEGHGYSAVMGLQRSLFICSKNEGGLFLKFGRSGEKGGRMSVGSHSQKNHVELLFLFQIVMDRVVIGLGRFTRGADCCLGL